MNLKDLLKNRYSVRNYLSREVEAEKIDYILQCARLAPSACNFQPWFFYVITDEKMKQGVQKSYDRIWFKEAPLYVVVCKCDQQSWKRKDGKDFGDVDAAIVAEHICLATAEKGLGTCWVCNFDSAILIESIGIPQEQEPIAIFPIGYIDEEKSKAPEKKRKSLQEITKFI